MHLVGFIIRIYHDARSPERPTCVSFAPVSKAVSLYKRLPTPIFLTSLIGPM